MNKSRIAIIALVLLAAVFAVGVGAGFRRSEDGPDVRKMDGDQIKAFVEGSVPDFFKRLQESLGSRGPALKAQDFIYPKFDGAAVAIGFSAKEPLVALIGRGEDENRKAVFKLVSGAGAFVKYEPKSLPAGANDPEARAELGGRRLELLRAAAPGGGCGKDDKSCAEISIFRDGGTLAFECSGDQPCRVELQSGR